MYSYDVRDAANRGEFDKFHNVSTTYGLAQVRVYDDEGEEQVLTVFITMCECPVCDGRGTYVNPAIDAGGLTPDQLRDFDDEDGYYEEDDDGNVISYGNSYLDGAYDQVCEACGGEKLYPEIDREKTPPEVLALIDAQQERDDYESSVRRAEMGWGW
jgi:hypothetical protein